MIPRRQPDDDDDQPPSIPNELLRQQKKRKKKKKTTKKPKIAKESHRKVQLTKIQNVQQHSQSQFVCRLGVDERVCAWHLNSNNKMTIFAKPTERRHPTARIQNSTLKQNYTHLVSLALDVSGTSVPNVLPDGIPNGDQLSHDTTQFSERHLSGDHTTAKFGKVLHPGLLQSPTKTHHQEVDHGGDF